MPVARSTNRRIELSKLINSKGVTMRPCNQCQKSGLECRKSEHSKKCGNCVRRGYACDAAAVSASDIDKVLRERRRLDDEEERAREQMRLAMSQTRDAMAKLDRLEKLKRFLSTREGELIRRGVQDVEELERLEEEERQASMEQSSSAATPSSSTFVTVLPSDLDFSAALSPGAQAQLDAEFAQFFADPGGSV